MGAKFYRDRMNGEFVEFIREDRDPRTGENRVHFRFVLGPTTELWSTSRTDFDGMFEPDEEINR